VKKCPQRGEEKDVAKEPAKKSKSAKTTTASPLPAAPKRSAGKKAAPETAKAGKAAKVAKGAKKLAKSPVAAEVVAATLVAAAAALRNPRKAQALALEAADDLKRAARSGIDSGEAMWKLALDVARKSIDALGAEDGKGKKGKSKKGKK
jgi:hypothetical protein